MCLSGCAMQNKYYLEILKTENVIKKSNTSNKIYLDGYFENISLREKTLDSLFVGNYKMKSSCPKKFYPIIFYQNGNVLFSSIGYCGDSIITYLNDNYIDFINKNGEWGTYEINGNKINVTSKFDSLGRNSLYYSRIIKFEGEILNDSTIINWNSLTPSIYFSGKNQILKFKKEYRVNKINPQNAWINKK
jgi:hypothetical protein